MDIDHYDQVYTIKYGDPESPQGPCVELTYDESEPSKLKLDYISFFPRCSIKGDLQQGDGTREMLASILKLCSEKFMSIKKIIFNDAAAFECNDENGRVVLSYYYLLLHGQTWYEKHFHAIPKSKDMRVKLQAFKALLSGRPTRNTFSFCKQQRVHNFDTWHKYFETMKRESSCRAFMDIQKEVEHVARVKLLYSEWYIRSRDMRKLDVGVKVKRIKAQGGGGFGVMTNQFV